MRKTVLAASWGILFLLGTDHALAAQVLSPFSKLCEAANVNAPDTSAADGPIEPGTDPGTQKAQAKPTRSVEDVALSERLQDLIENKLQQYGAAAAGPNRCRDVLSPARFCPDMGERQRRASKHA